MFKSDHPLRNRSARISAFAAGMLGSALVLVSVPTVLEAAPKVGTRAEIERILANSERDAAIFFVAKGGPNACGTGCSEWIAFQGSLNRGVAQRFRQFLDGLDGKPRTLFIDSRGGRIVDARDIGALLRERMIGASIGRTIPAGCRSFDESCRKKIVVGLTQSARLVTAGAGCSSACVELFLGAAVRQVPSDARLRIHSPILPPEAVLTEATRQTAAFSKKRYFTFMGIEPDFVEVIEKVPYENMRDITRSEMARFGIETRGRFETRWLRFTDGEARGLIWKAVTEPGQPGSTNYRTTRLQISCFDPQNAIVRYQRELLREEPVPNGTVRLDDGATIQFGSVRVAKYGVVAEARTTIDILRELAARSEVALTETRGLLPEGTPRSIKISTAGLTVALNDFEAACKPRPAVVAAAAPATAAAPRTMPAMPSDYRPIWFFHVKGPPDACGRGCSEWIAADGELVDPGAPKRLEAFLSQPKRRELPVFFNASAGVDFLDRLNVDHAMAVGRILRQHRMTTGVGRTIPDACGGKDLSDIECRVRCRRARHMRRVSTLLMEHA